VHLVFQKSLGQAQRSFSDRAGYLSSSKGRPESRTTSFAEIVDASHYSPSIGNGISFEQWRTASAIRCLCKPVSASALPRTPTILLSSGCR
jgi:hypothetical protein